MRFLNQTNKAVKRVRIDKMLSQKSESRPKMSSLRLRINSLLMLAAECLLKCINSSQTMASISSARTNSTRTRTTRTQTSTSGREEWTSTRASARLIRFSKGLQSPTKMLELQPERTSSTSSSKSSCPSTRCSSISNNVLIAC